MQKKNKFSSFFILRSSFFLYLCSGIIKVYGNNIPTNYEARGAETPTGVARRPPRLYPDYGRGLSCMSAGLPARAQGVVVNAILGAVPHASVLLRQWLPGL